MVGAGTRAPVELHRDGDLVVAEGKAYRWEWTAETDVFTVTDPHGNRIVSGLLQPAITVRTESGAMLCSSGSAADTEVRGNRLHVRYREVNKDRSISITLRFDQQCFWVDPLTYATPASENIVSVHYFARGTGVRARPSLSHTYLVQPGICESPVLSPIVPMEIGLDLTTWLGRGGMGPDIGPESQVFQQWALPVHYFCGVSRAANHSERESLTSRLSAAFCCGLADLPNADLMFQTYRGASSPFLNVRSDLWGHVRGPGTIRLGASLIWTFGVDYYRAVRNYYRALVDAGLVAIKQNSAAKNAVVTASQFNTWGAQCAEGTTAERFDQSSLEAIYEGMRASGMRPEMFVIDAKWEGSYGQLEHCPQRFPDFEKFLARVRADGHKIGLWAAFLRTNDPATVGLERRHLMHDRSGRPIVRNNEFEKKPYYLFDISQKEVQAALAKRIKEFVRRYQPDLVKFDFGYELPSLSIAAPADPAFAGEVLLKRGCDLLIGALREANPDIVVMYYSLSPLFLDYLDQHCHDDMYLCVDEYDVESDRRRFFSSLLGELGIPTYGSGGYDWKTITDIWFGSAVTGTVGSLGSFTADEHGASVTPGVVATFNGLSAIVRRTNVFTAEPLCRVSLSSTLGARSDSWLRYENGKLVMACLRKSPGRRSRAAHPSLVGLECDAPVVIASLDDAALHDAPVIGVVPFGTGELAIPRSRTAGEVRVTAHFGSGGTAVRTARFTDGAVRLPLIRADDDGALLEWLELSFDAN